MFNDKKKRASGATIDDCLDVGLKSLVAARPSVHASPGKSQGSSTKGGSIPPLPSSSAPNNYGFDHPIDIKPPAISFSPGGDDSAEFDFVKIVEERKQLENLGMGASKSSSSLYPSMSEITQAVNVPVAPSDFGGDLEDDMMDRKMPAKPAKKAPPSYANIPEVTPPTFIQKPPPPAAAPPPMEKDPYLNDNDRYAKEMAKNGGLPPPPSEQREWAPVGTSFGKKDAGPRAKRPGAVSITSAPVADVEAIQTAQEAPQSKAKEDKADCFKWGVIGGVALVVVIIVIVVLVVVLGGGDDSPTDPQNTQQTKEPLQAFALRLLPQETIDAVNGANTPQADAYNWMISDPSLSTYSDARIQQRFALATLYYATNGPSWTQNDNWLNNTIHECQWFFSASATVACGEEIDVSSTQHHAVKHVSLQSNRLQGTIPPEFFWLTSLQTVDMDDNRLQGGIPSEIGDLTALEKIDLSLNALTGTIPSSLGNLASLELLYLESNELVGTIPATLSNLSSLDRLDLQGNSLTGRIPRGLCGKRGGFDCIDPDNFNSEGLCGCGCGGC